MKPLDVAGGLDEHFGGLILPESELLGEGTDGVGNKALLIHLLSLSLLHDGLHLLFKLLCSRDFLNDPAELGTEVSQKSLHLVGRVKQSLRACKSRPMIPARPRSSHAH